MTTDQIRLAHIEHAAWLDLWKQLLALKAITQKDLEAPQSANQTPGQILLAAIRHWGNELAQLKIAANERLRAAEIVKLRQACNLIVSTLDWAAPGNSLVSTKAVEACRDAIAEKQP